MDKQGDFTCANTSTIDYCAASLELFHVLNNFAVDIFDPFLSDKHNPIVLRLNSESSYEKCKSEVKVKKVSGSTTKIKWSVNSAKDFVYNIDQSLVENIHYAVDRLEGHDIQIDQESIACLLKNIYLTAAKKSGMVKTYGNHKPCNLVESGNHGLMQIVLG